MRSTALAAAIGAIAAGACAGLAAPALAAPPSARRVADPMPREDPLPPEDPPVRAVTAPRIRETSATSPAPSPPASPPTSRAASSASPATSQSASRAASPASPAAAPASRPATSPPTSRAASSASPATSQSASRAASPALRAAAPASRPATSSRATSPASPATSSRATSPASPATAPPCGADRKGLRAPHRGAAPPAPPLRAPADLRNLVGRREPRDPLAAVAAWSRELGAPLSATSGAALVSWADESRRLHDPTDAPRPGDLLVFHQATSDDPADLVALVIDRDDRGVTEFLYVASGVVRRGFIDAHRPALRRDGSGATVNTYLRHGKRWPAKGSHYLAGELLGHVIRPR